MNALPLVILAGALLPWPVGAATNADPSFEQLFERPGLVTAADGWVVRRAGEVSNAPEFNMLWEVDTAGVLHSTGHYSTHKRWLTGTWLLSQKEYGDFILELDFRFTNGGAMGNGGIALRAPLFGDPAYNGLELQIVDERYERSICPHAGAAQFTGALYLLAAPQQLAYVPGEWNHYRIEMRGSKLEVWLNRKLVQDVDLVTLTHPARKYGKGQEMLDATPGAQRPLRGHIGFQDACGEGEDLMFRNVRIAELK
jgi:hypothetical protein